MTRTSPIVAVSLALLSATAIDAFPFPTKDAPLPAGAVRRFGKPGPPPKRVLDDDLRMRQFRARNEPSPTGAAIALTPGGKQVIVGQTSGLIEVYDLSTGRIDRTLQPTGSTVRLLTVSSDGRLLAASKGQGEVQVWDLPAGKVIQTFKVRADGEDRGQVERLAFGPGGRVLFTGADAFTTGENGGATAWDPLTGKRLWNTSDCGYNIAADPRGRWVLTSLLQESPTQLNLLDATTGKLARRLIIEPGVVEEDGLLFSAGVSSTLDRQFTPDGSRLVTFHDDGTVRVWDPETSRELTRMKVGAGFAGEPGGLAVSPDGRWVAARTGAEVEIWEAFSGRRVHTVRGLDGQPRELAFTRDGRGLVTSSGPAPILWSLRPTDPPPSGRLWELLAADDPTVAYRIVWALADDPKAAVRLFAEHVRPAELIFDRTKFDRLLPALDSADFATRERAERDLTAAGFTVPVAWLRTALAESKSEEVRARLVRILAAHEGPSPTRWRLERAVQVVELARTDEAAELLREWAAGPAGSVLTIAATSSLARIRPGP